VTGEEGNAAILEEGTFLEDNAQVQRKVKIG